MDEVISGYQCFFGLVYAFVFAVLYETYADKVLSFISKSKLEKWNESFRNILIRYSESDIKTNYRWLRIILLSLIGIGGLFAYLEFNIGTLYISVPIVIISSLLMSEKAFNSLCKHLFMFNSWIVCIMMIVVFGLIFYRHPECFLYGIDDDMIIRYTAGFIIGFVPLILISIVLFGLIYAIIPCSKRFTKLLIKKERVAEYCLTYISIASLTILISVAAKYLWLTICVSFQEYRTFYFY